MTSKTVAIIVNYNSGEWLKRCLTSLLDVYSEGLSHTYIVDNRSTDLSLDFIHALLEDEPEKFTLIENIRNTGFAKANNQILNQIIEGSIDCDYALLINPDCIMNVGVLPELSKALEEREDYGVTGCLIKNEDGSIQDTCRRNFPTPKTALDKIFMLDKLGLAKKNQLNLGSVPVDGFTETEALSGAFMLVKKSALLEVGPLDEGYFMHCEDLDWCMRFKLAGWKIGFSPDVSITHAKGVSSKSRPIGVLWTLHKGMARFFDTFYKDDYSLPYRVLVKVGIYGSFLLRATFTAIKMIVFQGSSGSIPKRYR